jgi:hypothetical protein
MNFEKQIEAALYKSIKGNINKHTAMLGVGVNKSIRYRQE